MMRNRPALFAIVASGALLLGVQSVDAKHQGTGSKPGIGVSGIGVGTVFIPAGGVTTPTVNSSNVTTPMQTGNPGVATKSLNTHQITGNPGATVNGVSTQMVTSAPGVATAAVGIGHLPSGYYTSIPGNAVQKMHKGELCYYVDGVYYRPEYYLGSLVYVKVA